MSHGRRPPDHDRDDRISQLCMYSQRDGSRDSRGLLQRTLAWADSWADPAVTVVFGHVEMPDGPRRLGPHDTVIGIDCDAAQGGPLTALRWPENTVVQTSAAPLAAAAARPRRADARPAGNPRPAGWPVTRERSAAAPALSSAP
jgi:hypothetical protein